MNFFEKIVNKIDWIYNTTLSKIVKGRKKIRILNFDDSVDELINNQSSLCRFGDGEFTLMLNGEFLLARSKDLKFQVASNALKARLREIIQHSDLEQYNLKVAVPGNLLCNDFRIYNQETYFFWENYLYELRFKIYTLLKPETTYLDALISRFYMQYSDKSELIVRAKIQKLQGIWQNKPILFIEGEGSKLGVNNDLFSGAKSISRIICPNKNAFDYYDRIFEKAKEYGENKLIILALGPTATVLAFDLARSGYRALDLGHIDIEYEWFLSRALTKKQVENKVITEVDGDDVIGDINLQADIAYKNQIVYSIK